MQNRGALAATISSRSDSWMRGARRIFEPFRSERMPNLSNAVRCRIID
jgi:hypothetical protein